MPPLHPLIYLVFVIGSAGPAAAQAWARTGPEGAALGNGFLEIAFDPQGRLAKLVNRLSGRTIALAAEGFRVELAGGAAIEAGDCALLAARVLETPGGTGLILRYRHGSPAAEAEVAYELGHGDPFLRRRLTLVPSAPLELGRVDAWVAGLAEPCLHQGYGEPLLFADTFWGLEYPGFEAVAAGGRLRLSHYPGRQAAGPFAAKTAVLGVAEAGRSVPRFREYLERIRLPGPALFVNYNTWWTLMPPDEASCRGLIELFRRNLKERHGEAFDAFTLDDGWDLKESLWAIDSRRFPAGFAPLAGPLAALGSALGLWLSPSSHYGHAPWGTAQGYEANSKPGYLCQSGPRYRRDLVPVAAGLAEENNLALLKLDGFRAECEAEGHGHRPGLFAREANIDAYIELLAALRRARPGVFLDLTCGIWLSPWWLQHAHTLWGEVGGDYPRPVVPGPAIRGSATTTRDAVLRQRLREHPAFPPDAVEHLGIIVITPEPWADNAMAAVGRGSRLLTLYIDPACLRGGERDWAFLASVLGYARSHSPILAATEAVGGDPLREDAYGYAHFKGDRGILSLRNPAPEPREIGIRLPAGGPPAWVGRLVYPRQESLPALLRPGGELRIRLQALETAALHLDPPRPGEPELLGVRAREAGRDENILKYDIYGPPGASLEPILHGGPGVRRARWEGREVPLAAGRLAAPLRLPGEPAPAAFALGGLEPAKTGAALRGCWAVSIPEKARAALHLLYQPAAEGDARLVVAAGGRELPVRVLAPPARPSQAHQRHSWTWFEAALPAGPSRVEVQLWGGPTGDFLAAEVGCWLWVERPLARAVFELELEERLPAADPAALPLPLGQEAERETLVLQPRRAYRVDRRWEGTGGGEVHLDGIAPDESRQGWGRLQFNRSVWEKPLVVAGRTFPRGLGTHAPGLVAYKIPANRFERIAGWVGRDAHAQEGRVAFAVRLDGREAFRTGPMTRETPAAPFDLPLDGAALVELLTLDGGDGIGGDHGDWGEVRLVRGRAGLGR